MQHAKSKDGTLIAYERTGSGPPLVIVFGALNERSATDSLAPLLAERFTVFAFDRRGRGDSGDTLPYSAEREIEDIAAILDEAGSPAYLYGHSSGGVLALDAVERLGRFERLALYEPPFIVRRGDDSPPPDYLERIGRLIRSGRRDEAVEYFLHVAPGIPVEKLGKIKASPAWPRMVRMADTLMRERDVLGETLNGRPLPADRWRHVTLPVLIMNGGASPDWFGVAADALGAILPNAARKTLAGENHNVEARLLASELIAFFNRGAGRE